jgi:nickel-dependent lactate racemase
MNNNSLNLPWGKEKVNLVLPPSWQVDGILEPAALAGVTNLDQELHRSLQAPIGCRKLSQLVTKNSRIALVMDDLSRPTPVAKLLPAVLEELKSGGVIPSQITLIPALGVHRPMNAGEINLRAGQISLHGLHWENPDCGNPEKLVFLGNTSRGVPVYVDKNVANADVIISIGCIEPHIIASFGGGFKNLFPGVAGRETIAKNHSLNATPDTFNMVGQPIEKNPMRLDLEESGLMLKKPVFIINAVLNSRLEVVRVVCGDAIAAHREGAGVSAKIYGVRISSPADVVITNSYPMETDLRQGVKALANTVRAVKRGGTLITLVRAEEGVGVFGLAERKLPVGRTGLKVLMPLLLALIPKIKLKGLSEEDRFFLYFALQAMRHCEMIMYAPSIPVEIQARLPFVHFVNSPEEAIQRAQMRHGEKANVLVFPLGGITYPIL